MTDAYLVEAVRTPVGRRGGGLSGIHPADLGAHVLTALIDRVDVDPDRIDDVIFGCVDTLVASARAVARHRLTPRARIVHVSARGADPIYMLSAPPAMPSTAPECPFRTSTCSR